MHLDTGQGAAMAAYLLAAVCTRKCGKVSGSIEHHVGIGYHTTIQWLV